MNYEIIIASAITAIATLLSVMVRQKYTARKPICPVTKDAIQGANVYTSLQKTLEEMGGDRAYVLEFHNGGSYYSGRGQQKFSCTHEVVLQGISRECNNSQEHRVSNYYEYINHMIKKGEFKYINAQEVRDVSFLQLINRSGIESIYNIPIKTVNGKIIGILGVDYVKKPSKDFHEKHRHIMVNKAKVIAGYLI